MALIDWKLITSKELFGRMAESTSPEEQARTFLHIAEIVRSEQLHGVILDMDHAIAHLPEETTEFAARILARELVSSGLQRFALVDRGIANAWWSRVMDRLREHDVRAQTFDRLTNAEGWFKSEA